MRRQPARDAARTDRGQATVELALCMPLICLLLLALVQACVVVRGALAVQLAAREGARAAAVAGDAAAAATDSIAALGLSPLSVHTDHAGRHVVVTVTYVERTDVPLIGALLPDVRLVASVTMAREPP